MPEDTKDLEKKALEERVGALEGQMQPYAIRGAVEDAAANSQFFRLGKLAAAFVATLVVVVFFGGEFLTGVKINSVDERAAAAKQLVSDAAKDASQSIEKKQGEVAIAAKSIEEQKLALEKLVSSAQDQIFGDARERVKKAAADVEMNATQAKQSIEQSKETAAKNIEDQVAAVKSLIKSDQDQLLKETRTSINAAASNVETNATQATQSIERSKDTATKNIEDQRATAKSRIDSTEDQLLQEGRTTINSAVSNVKTNADQATQAIGQVRDATIKRLDSSDIPSLPAIKETLTELKREVDALSVKESDIRFKHIRLILGKSYFPVLICLALGPLLGLAALGVAFMKHKA